MNRPIKYSAFGLFLFFSHTISFSRTYVITCATSGFGQAIAHALAQEDHSLILVGRNIQKLQELQCELEELYKGIFTIEYADYGDLATINQLGQTLKSLPINGIVIIPPRLFINAPDIPEPDEWLTLFNLGFIAPLALLKQLAPTLQPESAIVIVAGISSEYYVPEYKNTNVLRKMWIGELKNLIYQLSGHRIRVNAISPGVILTEFHCENIKKRAAKAHRTFEEQIKAETKDIPLHRYGSPEGVGHAVEFLLSCRSEYINGTNILIDGGLSRAY